MNKERRQDVKDHIYKQKPSIIGLVETKVRANKSRRILGCIPQGWGNANNNAYLKKEEFGSSGIQKSGTAPL